MKTLRDYKKEYLGTVNGEKIYLSPPSWDCGWYWGFGYLGNENCHYHVDTMEKGVNLHDAFIKHFGDTLIIRPSDIWTFSELFASFYALKEAAEVLGRGGSHLTSNPCKEVIINTQEVERINSKVLPAIFDEIYKIIERNRDNATVFKKLVQIDLEGSTLRSLAFMLENGIKPDDLKNIEGITKDDYYRFHRAYWKHYHKNK